MKRTAKPVFFIVALLILFLTYTSIWGISVQHGDNRITYLKGAGDIRWGIDIRGGVEATFSPDTICTRGQIATFLYRVENLPAGEAETTTPA